MIIAANNKKQSRLWFYQRIQPTLIEKMVNLGALAEADLKCYSCFLLVIANVIANVIVLYLIKRAPGYC
jgi:hypothetical protein